MESKSQYKQTLIRLAIFIGIGVLIKLLIPGTGTITPAGVTYLAIFVATVLCWIFIDTGWPSLLTMGALLLFNVMPTGTVSAGSWGTLIVVNLMFACVFSVNLREHGVLHFVARWFISRKAVHGRPYVFFILWGLAITVIDGMAGHIVAFTLFVPLLRIICEELGYEKGSKFHMAIVCLTLWTGVIEESVIPFAMPAPLSGIAILTGFGYPITMFDFMKYASIPVVVISIAVALFIIRFLIRPDMSLFSNYDDVKMREELKNNPLGKPAKILLLVYIIVIIGWALPSFSALGSLATWAGAVSLIGFSATGIALLNLLHIEGKPVMEVARDWAMLPWKSIVFISMIMLVSGTLASADYGIVAGLMEVLAPIAANLPLAVVIIAGEVVVIVLTNLMSNVVSMVVSLSVFIPVLSALETSPALVVAAGCLYIMSSSIAVLAPSAAAGVPIIMGVEASTKDLFKYSLPWVIGCAVLLGIVVIGLSNVLY